MSYDYQTERPKIFTEDGVKMLRSVEESVNILLDEAGSFQECKVKPDVGAYDGWMLTCCLDYLVEQGKLVRWDRPGCWGQYQVYALPQISNR